MKEERSLAWAAVPVVALALHAAILRRYTVDDALIVLRYARNAAGGLGLVYNPGEWVEGFSDPLWTALLTGALALGADGLVVAKVAGVAAAALALGVAALGAARVGSPTSQAAVLLTAVAAYTGYAYHAVAGLETGLHALLVTALAATLAADRAAPAALVAAVLVWSRPEGVLYAPLLLWLWPTRGLRTAAGALAAPAVSTLALLAVRWAWYGALLPNTFDAKMRYAGPLHGFALTILHTGADLAVLAPLFLLALVPLAAGAVPRSAGPWYGVVGVTLAFTAVAGADWMSWARFVVPALPALAVAASAGVDALVGDRDALRAPLRAALWVPVAFCAISGAGDRFRLDEGVWPVYPELNGADHRALGQVVARHARAGDTVVASQIGWIGWETEAAVIDLLGLTDREVPRLLGRGDLDGALDYLLARRPRVVVLTDRDGPTLGMSGLDAALQDRLETGGWRLAETVPLGAWRNALVYVAEDPAAGTR